MKVFQLIIAATLMVSTVADGHMEAEEPCDDDDEYVPGKSGKKSKKGKGKKNYGTGKSGKTGEGKGGKMKVGKGGKTGGGGSKSSKYPDGGHPSLYVMTNSAHGNAVQMYRRDSANGEIEYLASFATGGVGGQAGDIDGQPRPIGQAAPAPLGASGSLTNVDNRCLLAVNAGSNNVASFYIQDNGYLVRKSCLDSKGGLPVSTSYRDWNDDYLVYVLNAGGKGHLAGFHLDSRTCEMEYIQDSVWVLQEGLDQPGDLPNVFASPSQVSFSPDSEHLVVNIKRPLDTEDNVQGHFVVYRVMETGCLDHPVMSESNGNTPWAFIFSPHQKLISTEYNGPGFGGSHVSSYMFGGAEDCSTCDAEGGNLILDRTIPLKNDEYTTAMTTSISYSEVCGCAVTSNQVTQSADLFFGTLSTVQVNKKGHLSLIDPLAGDVTYPLDSSFSRQGDFLYVLSGGGDNNDQPAIYIYGVDGECTLTEIGFITDGLPTSDLTYHGVVGLALYM
mmetsp:Transcript_1323/g.3126  ORF Transcript_1323/g.3126 Transcript_1323/m.3126 type:complete len:501 (+) Transcript_1323:167-1669(+)